MSKWSGQVWSGQVRSGVIWSGLVWPGLLGLWYILLHSPNIYLLLIRGQNIFLLRIFFSFSFFVFVLLNGKNIFLLQISLFLLFLLFSERSSKILTRSTCNLCFFNFQFFRGAVGWWARFRGSDFICVFSLHFSSLVFYFFCFFILNLQFHEMQGPGGPWGRGARFSGGRQGK